MSGLLASVGSLMSGVLDYNKATLSGALDIIAVRHDDGIIVCTPFHVRFGKLKVFRSRDKVIHVYVNGKQSNLVMALGEEGEAYFLQTENGESVLPPMSPVPSLVSPPGSPTPSLLSSASDSRGAASAPADVAAAASPSAQPVRVAGVEDARREALGELVLPPPDSRGGSPHALDMSFDVREETTPATFDGMERIRVREAYREREAGEGDTFFSPLDTDTGASAGAGRPSVGTATGAPAGGDDVGEVPVSPASSRDSYASPCEELEDAGRGRARTTSMQEDIRRLSGMEALCTPIASAASEGGASRAASPPPAVLLSRSPVRSPCAAPVVAGGAGSRGSEAVPDTILDFVNLDAADTLNVEAMASPSDAAAMARALQAEKKHGAALPSTLPEASLPKGAFGVPLEQHSMHAAALGAPPAVAAVLEATLATGVGAVVKAAEHAAHATARLDETVRTGAPVTSDQQVDDAFAVKVSDLPEPSHYQPRTAASDADVSVTTSPGRRRRRGPRSRNEPQSMLGSLFSYLRGDFSYVPASDDSAGEDDDGSSTTSDQASVTSASTAPAMIAPGVARVLGTRVGEGVPSASSAAGSDPASLIVSPPAVHARRRARRHKRNGHSLDTDAAVLEVDTTPRHRRRSVRNRANTLNAGASATSDRGDGGCSSVGGSGSGGAQAAASATVMQDASFDRVSSAASAVHRVTHLHATPNITRNAAIDILNEMTAKGEAVGSCVQPRMKGVVSPLWYPAALSAAAQRKASTAPATAITASLPHTEAQVTLPSVQAGEGGSPSRPRLHDAPGPVTSVASPAASLASKSADASTAAPATSADAASTVSASSNRWLSMRWFSATSSPPSPASAPAHSQTASEVVTLSATAPPAPIAAVPTYAAIAALGDAEQPTPKPRAAGALVGATPRPNWYAPSATATTVAPAVASQTPSAMSTTAAASVADASASTDEASSCVPPPLNVALPTSSTHTSLASAFSSDMAEASVLPRRRFVSDSDLVFSPRALLPPAAQQGGAASDARIAPAAALSDMARGKLSYAAVAARNLSVAQPSQHRADVLYDGVRFYAGAQRRPGVSYAAAASTALPCRRAPGLAPLATPQRRHSVCVDKASVSIASAPSRYKDAAAAAYEARHFLPPLHSTHDRPSPDFFTGSSASSPGYGRAPPSLATVTASRARMLSSLCFCRRRRSLPAIQASPLAAAAAADMQPTNPQPSELGIAEYEVRAALRGTLFVDVLTVIMRHRGEAPSVSGGTATQNRAAGFGVSYFRHQSHLHWPVMLLRDRPDLQDVRCEHKSSHRARGRSATVRARRRRALSFDPSSLSQQQRQLMEATYVLWTAKYGEEAGVPRSSSADSGAVVPDDASASGLQGAGASGVTTGEVATAKLRKRDYFLRWIPGFRSSMEVKPVQSSTMGSDAVALLQKDAPGVAAPAVSAFGSPTLGGSTESVAAASLPSPSQPGKLTLASPSATAATTTIAPVGAHAGTKNVSDTDAVLLARSHASVASLDDLGSLSDLSYDTDGSLSASNRRDGTRRRYVRTLRPSHAQLRDLGLEFGPNQLTFVIPDGGSVTSTLYLWTPHTKIVVSDVDGTITKSDVLGHIYYLVGRDWTHAGVAQLYSNIRANGYQVMYLTSRAIGQTDATKEYLQNIKQTAYSDADFHAEGGKGSLPANAATLTTTKGTKGVAATRAGATDAVSTLAVGAGDTGSASIATGSAAAVAGGGAVGTAAAAKAGVKQSPLFQLPPGPVITSPDRLMRAFTREVILRRPQEFKIAALRDIARLFPHGVCPFYAGFGNRNTDVLSYRAVGVPDPKIFIINPQGEIRQFNLNYRKSYPSINAMVHEMFPAMTEAAITAPRVGTRYGRPVTVDEAYGDLTYWRRALPVVSEESMRAAMGGTHKSKPVPTVAKAKAGGTSAASAASATTVAAATTAADKARREAGVKAASMSVAMPSSTATAPALTTGTKNDKLVTEATAKDAERQTAPAALVSTASNAVTPAPATTASSTHVSPLSHLAAAAVASPPATPVDRVRMPFTAGIGLSIFHATPPAAPPASEQPAHSLGQH